MPKKTKKSKLSKRKSKEGSSTPPPPPFTSPLTSAHVTSAQNEEYNDEVLVEKEEISYGRKRVDHDDGSDNDDGNSEDEEEKEDYSEILKRKEAKRARLEAEAQEEKRLTSLLFGGFGGASMDDDVDENGGGGGGGDSAWMDDDDDDDDRHQNEGSGNSMDLFQIDRARVPNDDDEVEEEENGEEDRIIENEDTSDEDQDDDDDDGERENDNDSTPNSAWVDDDDDDIQISLQTKSDRIKKLRKTMSEDVVGGNDYESRLRERFQQSSASIANTGWANVDKITKEKDQQRILQRKDDEDDEEEEEEEGRYDGFDEDAPLSAAKLLSSTTSLLAKSSSRLPPHILSIVRCPDANQENYNQSTVQVVQFHPGSNEDEPLMLTAGLDKTLRFFKIGEEGRSNEKIHGINFPTLPIHSASFLGDTGSVVVSGRRPFFYIYDAEAGKIDKIPFITGRKEKSLEKFTTSPDGSLIAFIGNDGYIILMEAKSKMWVADLKMNGSARAVSFTPDGRYLVSSGSDGEVYRWDLRTKKCIDKFHNEDGTITSYISASSKFLAVGAESGVVNIYNDGNSVLSNRFVKRTPIKSIMNLHTSVDYMKFNNDGQILAMSSRREKDTLKLLHVPTQTVFSNWPTTKTPLSYVWSLDFSPGSKYMAVGNDKGKCLLYKLNHYNDDM